MIVIVKQKDGEGSTYIEDVAAVVWSGGNVRLCRDGKPDEYVNEDLVVVNDG